MIATAATAIALSNVRPPAPPQVAAVDQDKAIRNAEARWKNALADGRIMNVTGAEAAAMMQDGWTLLDVRPMGEKVGALDTFATPVCAVLPRLAVHNGFLCCGAITFTATHVNQCYIPRLPASSPPRRRGFQGLCGRCRQRAGVH